jgi:hypothetical protein
MKLISLSKTVRTICLITILSTIQGISLVQTAQAQTKPSTKSACTAAYFDDPGYMYSPSYDRVEVMMKSQRSQERTKRTEKMMNEITTFSAPLDSPLGYVINNVNGKEVSVPPNIKKAIDREMNRNPSPENRRRVAELNKKYGQYATFGQNIILIPSSEQDVQFVKDSYAGIADLKALLTPQELRAERDRATAEGCPPGNLYNPPRSQRTFTIDTGRRPDLDKRLREDKTGATVFK